MAYFLTTRNLGLGWWSCLRKSVIKSSSDFLFYTSLWVWFSSLQLKNAGSTSKPQGYDPGKKKRSKDKGQKKTKNCLLAESVPIYQEKSDNFLRSSSQYPLARI